MKYNIALIGSPVYHSKSPDIYAKIFRDAHADGTFTILDIKSIDGIRNIMLDLKIDAFAVTMPHKASIISELDNLDEAAEFLQSVNFVTIKSGIFKGYSTDGEGFCRSLDNAKVDINGKKVLIYGTGGAARAVCYSLINHGACVSVCGRNPSHVHSFSDKFGVCEDILSNASHYDIFINATPLGMTEQFDNFDFLISETKPSCVCDLVYSPANTQLIEYAKNHGIFAMNGLSMLHDQAHLAFSLLLK